jgi:hypothetical protein
MKKSIYNILKECSEPRSVKERVQKLQQNGLPVVLQILKYAFDPNIKFLLPEGTPPYKPNDFVDQEGILFSEARKIYLFVEGGNNNLTKVRREMLFIQFIEGIDKNDAILMCSVKDKKLPFKSLTADVVKQAFPNIF